MIHFKSKITRKILNHFFSNEKKDIYVNELARILQEDPKNVYRMLLSLQDDGILHSEFRGKQRYFSANKKSLLYKEYKSIFLKTAGIENTIKEAIKEVPGIQEAYIYGSYASNRLTPDSAIELLLVGAGAAEAVNERLAVVERTTGHKVSITAMTPEELDQKRGMEDEALTTIFEHKTIKLL